MTRPILTGEDIRRIEAEDLTEDKVLAQLEFFKRGASPVRLNRACTVGDGITVIPNEKMEELMAIHDEAAGEGRMLKFVPASGAASRMFREWYRCYNSRSLDSDPEMGADFALNLNRYAFYDDLRGTVSRAGYDIADLVKDRKFSIILEYILTVRGLNYAHLPKALLNSMLTRIAIAPLLKSIWLKQLFIPGILKASAGFTLQFLRSMNRM